MPKRTSIKLASKVFIKAHRCLLYLYVQSRLSSRLSAYFFVLSVIGLSGSVSADKYDINTLVNVSLESLTNTQEASVAKKMEKLFTVPASINVITAVEIYCDGAASISEALRLALNLQVTRVNVWHYAISVRGFSSTTANKLQVLVDGRIEYMPSFWKV